MNKILMMAVLMAMTGGAYATDFGTLAVKANDIKALSAAIPAPKAPKAKTREPKAGDSEKAVKYACEASFGTLQLKLEPTSANKDNMDGAIGEYRVEVRRLDDILGLVIYKAADTNVSAKSSGPMIEKAGQFAVLWLRTDGSHHVELLCHVLE